MILAGFQIILLIVVWKRKELPITLGISINLSYLLLLVFFYEWGLSSYKKIVNCLNQTS